MREAFFYILSSFWAGAVHAATPGHGKTIAAAYIVGARGKPSDAVILGIFVTLSHVSGIVLVGVLASLGSSWLVPQRIEAYLALAMGILVIGLGLWMLWLQRDLLALAMGEPAGLQPFAPQAPPHVAEADRIASLGGGGQFGRCGAVPGQSPQKLGVRPSGLRQHRLPVSNRSHRP